MNPLCDRSVLTCALAAASLPSSSPASSSTSKKPTSTPSRSTLTTRHTSHPTPRILSRASSPPPELPELPRNQTQRVWKAEWWRTGSRLRSIIGRMIRTALKWCLLGRGCSRGASPGIACGWSSTRHCFVSRTQRACGRSWFLVSSCVSVSCVSF